MKAEEKIGNKYGCLTVMSIAGRNKEGKPLLSCLCECGKETTVRASKLRHGYMGTKSCGCLRGRSNITHGFSNHSLYHCWTSIKDRCYHTKCASYPNYGGRGIFLYKPWLSSPRLFIQWIERNLGQKPESYSLDRINNNGNYVPGNMRWASNREQTLNRRKQSGLPVGVYKSRSRYAVSITVGRFDTVKEAEEAYAVAKELLRD